MAHNKIVVVGVLALMGALAGCAQVPAGDSSAANHSAVIASAPSGTPSIGPGSTCASLLVEAKVGSSDPIGLASCSGDISPTAITQVHAKVGEKIELTTQGQPISSLTVDNSGIADPYDGYILAKSVGTTKVHSGNNSLYCNNGSAPLAASQCVLFDLTVES